MKIAVVNDILSAGGEETLWNVLVKELDAIPVEFAKGEKIPEDTDLVITNSIWGKKTDKPSIVFLQDSYMAMAEIFGIDKYRHNIRLQRQALQNATIRVANSPRNANYYTSDCGKFEVIYVGTNSNLFRPMNKKKELRKKYGIPENAKVNIWVGSHHPVKRFDLIDTSKDFWILVFKDFNEPKKKNILSFTKISQEKLAELHNCADQFVSTNPVEMGGLALYEAMFCNLPVKVIKVGVGWDWYPENKNPRQEAFDRGLDRETMIRKWKELVKRFEVKSVTKIQPNSKKGEVV